MITLYSDFNPRSREGSDVSYLESDTYHNDFNPRSREGSDEKMSSKEYGFSVFQSTLPRRERLVGAVTSLINSAISIHAPAKGATMWKHIFPICLL